MNTNNLTYSSCDLALTEQFEGLSLVAYRDVAGVWTNGYGNTHGVVPGSTITLEQAQSDLSSNIAGAVYVVNQVVSVVLNQNQFDALVDFVFNLGSSNFQSSTLLRELNEGNFVGASGQFPLWNHAGGVVVEGLTRRRLAEQSLFNTPVGIVPSQVLSGSTPVAGPAPSIAAITQEITSILNTIQKDL